MDKNSQRVWDNGMAISSSNFVNSFHLDWDKDQQNTRQKKNLCRLNSIFISYLYFTCRWWCEKIEINLNKYKWNVYIFVKGKCAKFEISLTNLNSFCTIHSLLMLVLISERFKNFFKNTIRDCEKNVNNRITW